MESKPSPDRHRAEDLAWSISGGTRQGAQEADACMAYDDWLYASPSPPAQVEPPFIGTTTSPRTPVR
ncbi:hypothetical protein [Hymenobacter terricola]|uniref:hypothetical protein n=1 Tax=Hymenobacter terricola TaxID=2819236 RepID=UPI001B30D705|nr:hypothetical protein [Hymenobacter terricola]